MYVRSLAVSLPVDDDLTSESGPIYVTAYRCHQLNRHRDFTFWLGIGDDNFTF